MFHIFFQMFINYFQSFNYDILGSISCVRWNPNGDMLATACYDRTAKLLDFRTGKTLHTVKTSDDSKFLMFNIYLIFN